jgi:hypothetical protein
LSGRLLVTFPPDDPTYGTFAFEGRSSASGMTFTNTSSGTVTFRPDAATPTAVLTLYPEQGNVTDGRMGRSGFEGEPELPAEAAEAVCG